jgi:hypothetical protein
MEDQDLDLSTEYEDTNIATDQDEGGEEFDWSDDNAIVSKLTGLLGTPDEKLPNEASNTEEQEQQEEQVEETKPELITVKVDGVEKQVTLDELKNGYQRQADYTQKTQALSQEKQQLQVAQQQYQQYIQSIPMAAQTAQKNIQEANAYLYSQEMVELATSDPSEYVAQKAKVEAFLIENTNNLQTMDQQYQEFNQQQQATYQAQLADVIEKSTAILVKEIPGYDTAETKSAIVNYALANGYQAEDLNNLYDHRQVIALNKARLYDELVANKSVASKRVEKMPPRTITTGLPQQTKEQNFQARKKAALKSGDDHEIANFIAGLL